MNAVTQPAFADHLPADGQEAAARQRALIEEGRAEAARAARHLASLPAERREALEREWAGPKLTPRDPAVFLASLSPERREQLEREWEQR